MQVLLVPKDKKLEIIIHEAILNPTPKQDTKNKGLKQLRIKIDNP